MASPTGKEAGFPLSLIPDSSVETPKDNTTWSPGHADLSVLFSNMKRATLSYLLVTSRWELAALGISDLLDWRPHLLRCGYSCHRSIDFLIVSQGEFLKLKACRQERDSCLGPSCDPVPVAGTQTWGGHMGFFLPPMFPIPLTSSSKLWAASSSCKHTVGTLYHPTSF